MTQATQQPWTIKRLLDWTVEHFKNANFPGSRLDAEVLLAESMGCPRINLYTRFDEVPPDPVMSQFREWVKRRAQGEPVAYLVGHREFYSLKFLVNSSVLIPRPETEHVVMAALAAVDDISDRPLRIIDVGTGSGCIAITLAKQLADIKKIDPVAIAATDLSGAAIEVANKNAQAHDVADQIRFFQGDLLAALPSGSQPVHLIVSNPPYIGTGEINTLDDNVKNHEPHIALFGGTAGTEIIDRLISQASNMLLPGGALIFETSPINIDCCLELVSACDRFTSVHVDKDFSGLNRVVVAKAD